MRGATNAILQLTNEEKAHGVVTHSSGNHAQALALAAKNTGIKSTIVMPDTSPSVKRNAVLGYGAEVITCASTLDARETTTKQVIEDTGATLIHPYNDYRIIAGQATAAMELIDEVASVEVIVTPVGGGGLLAGTALSATYFSNSIHVYGAEPENADDAKRSFDTGALQPMNNPNTVADGLRTALGEKGYSIIKDYVKDIITVREQDIIDSMRLIWERMKIIVEPSSAVPLAAILNNEEFSGKQVGIILSGGNVDMKNLPF